MPQKAIFYGAFLFLQIIAAPLQAGYSDFYCRKKSLIASLGCSALSLVFVFFYFNNFFPQILILSFAALLKATLGNTLPLSWAGIADTKNQNYRFSLGLSTSIIAIGYLVLIIIDTVFSVEKSIVIIFLMFICLIPFMWAKFFDLIDRKGQRERFAAEFGLDNKQQENRVKYFSTLLLLDSKSLLKNFLKCRRFCLGLLGVFLPLETSFYSTHALGVDLAIEGFEIVTVLMIIGYLFGVLSFKYCVASDDDVLIKIGYRISISSFLPMFVLIFFLTEDHLRWVIAPCYFVYSFGVAFIVPSLFSTLSKERDPTEQGKIYGLIDSTDTIALLVAVISGFVYNYSQKPAYTISFSFATFLISRYFYAKFGKTHKKVSQE